MSTLVPALITIYSLAESPSGELRYQSRVASPKPKHEVSRLNTDVDICRPLMSFREGTDDHQIRSSRLDIGLIMFGLMEKVRILSVGMIST